MGRVSYPKIELHVHLEGTVRPAALLRFARRNGVALPADSVEELARIYEFRGFRHFLDSRLRSEHARAGGYLDRRIDRRPGRA